MKHTDNIQSDRRRFLNVAALGSAAAVSASAAASETAKHETLVEAERILIDRPNARRIAAGKNGSFWLLAGTSVDHLDAQGNRIGGFSLERPGRALAVGDTNVLVAIRNQVHEFSYVGEHVRSMVRIPKGLIGDIVVAGDRLVVTDLALGRLLRSNKANWEVFGEPIRRSSRLTRGASGDLVIADPERHHVKVLDAEGLVRNAWGKRSRTAEGFQGCCNPMAIAHTRDGNLVTAEAGQVRIKAFTHDGVLMSEVAGPDTIKTLATSDEEDRTLACAAGGVDVASNGDGDIYFLHAAAREVIRFESV